MTPTRGLLLDTCALIWLANGERMAPAAVQAIVDAGLAGGVYVSPVSAWEIGMLSRPRANRAGLAFRPDAKAWLARFLARPGIRLAALTPEIAVDSAHLPEPLHADPGDRLLIATARDLGLAIVTRNSRIMDYAAAGHVAVLAC